MNKNIKVSVVSLKDDPEKREWIWYGPELQEEWEGIYLPGYNTALEYGKVVICYKEGTVEWGFPAEVIK